MLNWRDPTNPKSGGAERVTEAYLRGLLDRGHEVYWFSFAYPNCKEEENLNGIKVIRKGDKFTAILAAWKWYKKIGVKFDLVIDQIHGIPWYAPWWAKTNVVAYLHEVLGPIWKSFYRPIVATIGQIQEKVHLWLYKNVPFWTSSNSTTDMLYKIGVRNVIKIPNGVDAKPLEQLPLKQLDLPLRLVVVSRLAPNKRIDHVFLVIKILKEMKIPSYLTVVGTGDDEQKLKALQRQLGLQREIEFLGFVSEEKKLEVLKQAHFLIHTSLREGWGLNVIEANAMGTPAIVYPVAGLVDSTIHDQTGVIVDEERPEAIVKTIVELLSNQERYQRYRYNAWVRAKFFQWENVLPLACERLESLALGKIPQSVDF